MPTIAELAAQLAEGRTTSEELVEECLARIADPNGEGGRTYLEVDAEGGRNAARAMDALRSTHSRPFHSSLQHSTRWKTTTPTPGSTFSCSATRPWST